MHANFCNENISKEAQLADHDVVKGRKKCFQETCATGTVEEALEEAGMKASRWKTRVPVQIEHQHA